jgi:uncharacterized membrane protein
MSCIGCNSKEILVDNEFLCTKCFEKIRGTSAEQSIKSYERFMPIFYGITVLLSILLIIAQILWYLGKFTTNYMGMFTFLIFGLPIILKVIVIEIVINKIYRSENLKDTIKKRPIQELIKQYTPELLVCILLIFVSLYIFQIWNLIFGILTFLWDAIRGIFL